MLEKSYPIHLQKYQVGGINKGGIFQKRKRGTLEWPLKIMSKRKDIDLLIKIVCKKNVTKIEKYIIQKRIILDDRYTNLFVLLTMYWLHPRVILLKRICYT